MTNTLANREGWTDERVEALKLPHKDGLSASLIAKNLGGGLSRNAVIGKIHRLGIQRTGVPSKPTTFAPYPERKAAAQQRRKQPVDGFTYGVAHRPKPQYQERRQPVSGPIDSPNAKVWTERLFGECAYPLEDRGEGADTVSCANRIRHGSSYCSGHHSAVFQAASKTAPAQIQRSIIRTQEWQRGGITYEEWAAA